MVIRRRTLIALSLAAACAILSSLKLEAASRSTATFIRGDANERIEFKFESLRLYEVAHDLVMGVSETGGTYDLKDENGFSRDSGKFKLVMDDSGYVAAYALTTADGEERRWTSIQCSFLTDDRGSSWQPTGSAPIQMYQGLIADLVGLL
jgi:hypothetical protein